MVADPQKFEIMGIARTGILSHARPSERTLGGERARANGEVQIAERSTTHAMATTVLFKLLES